MHLLQLWKVRTNFIKTSQDWLSSEWQWQKCGSYNKNPCWFHTVGIYEKKSSNCILMDTWSTAIFGNVIYTVVPVQNWTEDEILVVHTNGFSNTLTNIAPSKILPLDIHINEYSMSIILSLKYVSTIPGFHIAMN